MTLQCQTHGKKQTQQEHTTTSIAHGAGRVQPTAAELEAIRQEYVDEIGALNAIKARDIEAAIEAGVQASAILDAIEQTALAPRPSHYYLRAILRRYAAEGITTAEEAERSRGDFRTRRAAAGRDRAEWWHNPALDYAQREYKQEDFNEGFYVDLSQYAEV